jgi:hypothetical protein
MTFPKLCSTPFSWGIRMKNQIIPGCEPESSNIRGNDKQAGHFYAWIIPFRGNGEGWVISSYYEDRGFFIAPALVSVDNVFTSVVERNEMKRSKSFTFSLDKKYQKIKAAKSQLKIVIVPLRKINSSGSCRTQTEFFAYPRHRRAGASLDNFPGAELLRPFVVNQSRNLYDIIR